MRRTSIQALVGLAIVSLLPLSAGVAQETEVVSYSLSASSRDAALQLQLADGSSLRLALGGGEVSVNGEPVGRYQPGGQLDEAWRDFMAQAGGLSVAEFIDLARSWEPGGLDGPELGAAESLRSRFGALEAAEALAPSDLSVVVIPAVPEVEIVGIESARLAAEEARVAVESIRDEIRSSIQLSIREAPRQRVREAIAGGTSVQIISPAEGVWHGMLGLMGAFLALTGIGFGASFFADRQLNVMADTVSTSFARSFFVGLFAQPLIIPAFGMMIIGLALTVIGILVIPVAAIAFAVALVAASIGGYLAVARVAGATLMRRKNLDYGADGFGMVKSLAWGLGIALGIWIPAIALAWAPVAGPILQWTAIAITWALATTGFGAAILTRGGVRGTFGRRFAPRPIDPDALFAETTTEVATGEWLAGKVTQ